SHTHTHKHTHTHADKSHTHTQMQEQCNLILSTQQKALCPISRLLTVERPGLPCFLAWVQSKHMQGYTHTHTQHTPRRAHTHTHAHTHISMKRISVPPCMEMTDDTQYSDKQASGSITIQQSVTHS